MGAEEKDFGLIYSDAYEFNNSKTAVPTPILGEYSAVRSFRNDVNNNRYDYIPTEIISDYTTIRMFNNGYLPVIEPMVGEWSVGVFDINSNISLLEYDDYNYNEIAADLLYPELTYNWFNNNIPSKKIYGQLKLIPWGFEYNFAQFSVRFPSYTLETQVEVSKMAKEYGLDTQVFATPPIPMDYAIATQGSVELDKYKFNFQFALGENLTRLLYVQGEVESAVINPLNIQNILVRDLESELPIQNTLVNFNEDKLDLETNIIGIDTEEVLDLQLTKVDNTSSDIETQFEVLEDRIDVMNIQTLVSAPFNTPLDLQYTMAYTNDIFLDIESELSYPLGSTIDLQVDMYETIVLGNLDTQFFATPPIAVDDTLDLQYTVNYNGTTSIDTEFRIEKFISDKAMDLQVLGSATIDSGLDIEMSTLIEYSVPGQFRSVALNYHEQYGQLYVLPILANSLTLQTNLIVTKEYDLDLQSSIVIESDHELDLQYDIDGITKEYYLTIQSIVDKITKYEGLDLQWVNALDDTHKIDLQGFVNVEAEHVLDIMTDVIISKNMKLDLETFVTVNKTFGLDLQSSLVSVTANTSLELEFDVLDLVYYMIHEGYNIVPWWSDGLGSWDMSVDKNWNKEDLSKTTIKTGLLNQLNDLNINIDDIEMLDIGTKNFVYYNTLINNGEIELEDKILKLQYSGEKRHLTLGKSKKGSNILEFKEGVNVIFYDGPEENFNSAIRQHIADKLVHVLVWIPETGTWSMVTDDYDLYFYEEVNGKVLPMPYIFVIEVSEDCSINILR